MPALQHPDLGPVQRGAEAKLFLGEAGALARSDEVVGEALGGLGVERCPSGQRPFDLAAQGVKRVVLGDDPLVFVGEVDRLRQL